MKSLFLYIDQDFSFHFGHYLNIFENLRSICNDNDFDIKLFHSYWEYHKQEHDQKFTKFGINAYKSSLENLSESIISNVEFRDYESVIVYAYKGSLNYINSLLKIEKLLQKVGVPYRIILTLFTFPFDQLEEFGGNFSDEFKIDIDEAKQRLIGSSIELVHDVESSIWHQYIDNVSYLPPALLQDSVDLKRKSVDSAIRIGLDIWNPERNPNSRYEDILFVKEYIRKILKKFPNVEFCVKIADSLYQIVAKKSDILASDRVSLISNLGPDEYQEYLQTIDIYLLQYSPAYYQYKSSGHLVELMQYGVSVVGTKGTIVEQYLSKCGGHLYQYGNLEDLISTTCNAIKERVKYSGLLFRDDTSQRLIKPWTKTGFQEKVFDRKKLALDHPKRNKPFIIIGNGPSLKGFDFEKLKDYDCIGMNAAYRYWDRISWYPRYYICLDDVVVQSHSKEIARLIKNSDEYGIEEFFLKDAFFEFQPDLRNHPKVIVWESMRKSNPVVFDCIHVTTGSFAARYGIFKGYTLLLMLGIDETYVNYIPESERGDDIKLKIVAMPKDNPNYFFSDYQQVGDEYQIANHSKVYKCNCRHCNGETRNGETLHVDAWKFINKDFEDESFNLQYGKIEVFNCNKNSAVKEFEFADFDSVRFRKPIVDRELLLRQYGFASKQDEEGGNDEQIPILICSGYIKYVSKFPYPQKGTDSWESYSLKTAFRPYFNEDCFDGFGKHSPPMPFLFGCIGVYDCGTHFSIVAATKSGPVALLDVKRNMIWIELEIQHDLLDEIVSICVDGILRTKKHVSVPELRKVPIQIGCGYLCRYWRGEVLDVSFTLQNSDGKECSIEFPSNYEEERFVSE
ncbi:MAG: hypothetical protein ABQ298_06335 [Puniceicoccaceae bacterium]